MPSTRSLKWFLMLSALAMGLSALRFQWRARAALNFPEASLNITDAASFTQVAAYQAMGRVYGPPEEGVGLIYAPLTVAFIVAAHQALGIAPTPPSARWLGQLCFFAGLGLLAFCIRREFSVSWGVVLLASCVAWFSQLLSGTYDSVYTSQLRLLMLGLLWMACLLESPWAGFFAVILVCGLGCGSPNFLACGLVLLPRFLRDPRQRAPMLMGGMLGLACLAWTYGSPWRAYWCLWLPLSKPTRPLARLIFDGLNPKSLWPYLAVGGSGVYAMLYKRGAGKDIPVSAWLAVGALLGSFPPAMKLGGGAANLAPFAWIALPAGLAWAWDSVRPKALWMPALGILFLLLAGRGVLSGARGPRRPTEIDLLRQRQLESALDWAAGQKLKIWVDSAPAYFASRRMPFSFDAAHIWDQRVSGDLRSFEALKAALQRHEFGLVAVHVDPEGVGPVQRCLGQEFLDLIRSKYRLAMTLPRDPVSDAALSDPRFNGTVEIYLDPGLKPAPGLAAIAGGGA